MAKRQSNRLVRQAIRDIFEPELAALGFAGKYPEFRREWEGETHFLLFQTAKYGGSFQFSVGWRKRRPYVEKGLAAVPPEETTIAHTDFDDRAYATRVMPMGIIECQRMAWRSVGDFDYAPIVEDADQCRLLVEEAVAILPRMDHWLKTREPSVGVNCNGHRMRNAFTGRMGFHMARGRIGHFDLSTEPPHTPFLTAQAQDQRAPEYWVD